MSRTKKTPMDKLKQWRNLLGLRLPLLGEQGHYDRYDLDRLDEIIQLLEPKQEEDHCWGNHQHFFKDSRCSLDTHFCEDSPKCYLVAMEKYNRSEDLIINCIRCGEKEAEVGGYCPQCNHDAMVDRATKRGNKE